MTHKFKPGDLVRYTGDDEDHPEEIVIGEEEWNIVKSVNDQTVFDTEKVYTISAKNGTYLGKCYPKNFEMVKPFRDIIFKECL